MTLFFRKIRGEHNEIARKGTSLLKGGEYLYNWSSFSDIDILEKFPCANKQTYGRTDTGFPSKKVEALKIPYYR